MRRALRDPSFVIGALIVLGVLATALFAPYFAPTDPLAISLLARNAPSPTAQSALAQARRVGEVFPTRVSGVQSFGMFVTIVGLGGDGLVPVSTLGDERFSYDEKAQALVGDRTGERRSSQPQMSGAALCKSVRPLSW